MTTSTFLTTERVASLATPDLRFSRSERYGGDGVSVPLEMFAPEDRQAMGQLYARLNAFQQTLEKLDDGASDEALRQVVREFLAEHGWRPLMELANSLDSPPRTEVDASVSRACFRRVRHDIKGGALVQLVSALQLAERGALKDGQHDEQLHKIHLRVRDHTKIMRNAVPELDPERYARDSQEKIHEAGLLVEKWERTELTVDEQVIDIRVTSEFEGPISDRCIEFAALDRVTYNLMNNAVEGTAEGHVELFLTAVPDSQPDHLRIAVANPVDATTADTLRDRFGGDDLSELFLGGFTTGGHGLGLNICATFVGFAYGVTPDEAIAEGHLGARLMDGHFVNWVHWPIVSRDD